MEVSKKTILIVEDDRFVTKVYQAQLEKEGFNIFSLSRGEDAFQKCKELNPNLVILDLNLPGMSGFEVLEKLKKDPSTNEVPVLILSNLGQESDVNRGLSLGAVDFVIKANISTKEVIENIRKYMN